jgi:leader peptidase (prepilin peptidase) / N-methyltransferase
VTALVFMQILLGLFGLVMGSAVTAIVHRVPRHRSWVEGRSGCPHCQTELGTLDLVPVFSFLFARGRCRHCGEPIAFRYPLTELLCAAWALLLFDRVGLVWAYVPLAFWGFLLIALTWIDLDFQLLPDVLTFPGTLLGITAALLRAPSWPDGTRHALLGVVVGSGLLWALAWLYLKLRKIEGMGGGDIKLAAMFGAVLGWKLTLMTLFIASFAGAIVGLSLMAMRRGDGKTALPFGTFLAPAAMAVFLWGPNWIRAYLGLFHRT